MHHRKRERHDRTGHPMYYTVEVREGLTLHFRTPLPIRSARILQLLSTHGIERAADVDPTAMSDDDYQRTMTLWAICGAAIGLSWAHPTEDLDSVPGGDLMRYGDEVLAELYEDHGMEVDDFAVLFPAVMKRITMSLISPREVKERADFSAPSEAKPS